MAKDAITPRRTALKALISLGSARAGLPLNDLTSSYMTDPLDKAIARWEQAKADEQAVDDEVDKAFVTHLLPYLVKGVVTTHGEAGPRIAKSESKVREHFEAVLHVWRGTEPQHHALTARMNAAIAELKAQQKQEDEARARCKWHELIQKSNEAAEEQDSAFEALMDYKPRNLNEARRKMLAVADELSGRMQDDTPAQCRRHMTRLFG